MLDKTADDIKDSVSDGVNDDRVEVGGRKESRDNMQPVSTESFLRMPHLIARQVPVTGITAAIL